MCTHTIDDDFQPHACCALTRVFVLHVGFHARECMIFAYGSGSLKFKRFATHSQPVRVCVRERVDVITVALFLAFLLVF